MHISIMAGFAHTPNGEMIDLLEVQACCVNAFQDTGSQRYAAAADELSKLTGKVMGPQGDWVDRPLE